MTKTTIELCFILALVFVSFLCFEFAVTEAASVQEPIAFVAYYVHPEPKAVFYARPGEKRRLPAWASMDFKMDEMNRMIGLNFESARLTHPNCRLILLTDVNTTFDHDKIDPNQPGPPVELLRIKGLDRTEEMISRLRSRVTLLEREKGTHHLVFLDTDMLVVKSLQPVFKSLFDVALTWRHDTKMPVNGGIIFAHKDRISNALGFFRVMLSKTQKNAKEALTERRWFGQSDQVALTTITSPDHGYKGVPISLTSPGKGSKLMSIRTWYTPPEKQTQNKNEQELSNKKQKGYDVKLFNCELYNGTGAPKRLQKKYCAAQGCCCSKDSSIIHFKGGLKSKMSHYWRYSCKSPEVYQCATIQEKCKQL